MKHNIARILAWSTMLLAMMTFTVASLADEPSAKPVEGQIGIVLLHGKQGSISEGAINDMYRMLHFNGYLVSVPDFPWSKSRYIDLGIEDTYEEIARRIRALREEGAVKIVLMGQSMGSNMALSYAVHRGGIQGLVMVSPGHVPESRGARQRHHDSLQLARNMVAEGHGEETASFADGAQGEVFTVRMKARIYLDFFTPNGKAAMSRIAEDLDRHIPVLYVVGTSDKMSQRGEEFIFDRFPPNPAHKYLVVNADHYSAAFAARNEIVAWLKGL